MLPGRTARQLMQRWARSLGAADSNPTLAVPHARALSGPGEEGDSAPKHWTQADVSERHWLDRRLPGARQWLEDKNRALWLRGIQEQSRKFPSLQGREAFIKEQLSQQYHALLEKHAALASDDRSQTHLQMGCLVLATDKVLLPFVRDPQAVDDIIRQQMGAFASPFLRFLLRHVMLLTRDPFASAVRRLRGLCLDYGGSFEASLLDSASQAELRVTGCFYHQLLSAEGRGRLLACCCCSQDRMWFEGLQRHGVAFEQPAWLGAGDDCCCLQLARLK